MKGMLTKAFSLTLLLSVAVQSVAMDSVAQVSKAAQEMAEAASTETAIKNAVVGAVAGSAAQAVLPAPATIWEKAKGYSCSAVDAVKGAGSYLANTRVAGYASTAAGYAHSAITAPFNVMASKSGLADRIANLGFVKNNPTVAGYAKTAAQYAVGLGLVYAAYKTIKAGYNYVTTPAVAAPGKAKKHPEVKVPVVASTDKNAVITEAQIEASNAKHYQAVVKAVDAFVAAKISGKEQEVKAAFEALSKLAYANIIFAKKCKKMEKPLPVKDVLFKASLKEDKTVLVKLAEQVKAHAAKYYKQQPSFARTAYNALVNRYTIGAAALGSVAYVGYKLYNAGK